MTILSSAVAKSSASPLLPVFNENPRVRVMVVVATASTIAADFLFIWFLFGLQIRDFSLKLGPVQLCCSQHVAAAANPASR